MSEFLSQFLRYYFDILFCLVFTVIDLLYFVLQLGNETKCMSLWVIFSCTHCVAYVIVIMSGIPYPIRCSQFLSFSDFSPQCFDFCGHLNCEIPYFFSITGDGCIGWLIIHCVDGDRSGKARISHTLYFHSLQIYTYRFNDIFFLSNTIPLLNAFFQQQTSIKRKRYL